MACDADGTPTKAKMVRHNTIWYVLNTILTHILSFLQSQITVASDKARGILGKCDLDIAKFDYDDFRMHTIEIRECAYEGATIEIGLKATNAMRSSTRNNALNESYRSEASHMSAAVPSDPQAAKARFNELFDEYSDLKK